MKKESDRMAESQRTEEPASGFPAEDRLLTLQEVAQFLQLKPATVRDMALKKEIPALFVRRRWRFSLRELKIWVENNQRI